MSLLDRKRFISYLSGVFLLDYYTNKTEAVLLERSGNMARRTEQSKVSYGKEKEVGIGEWLGFVDVKLPKEARLKALESDTLSLMDNLDDLLQNNYKVSMTWDKKTETFLVSISCYDATSPNFKRTLTTRYTSALEALKLALWKDSVFLKGVWVSETSKDENLG